MLGHDRRVSAEPLTMERRLRKPTLPAMRGTFTIEETLTEKLLGDVATATFDELSLVGH